MAIDTLKVARRLREAGFDEAQADAVIAAVQEGAEGADLATKADLALIIARFDALQSSVDARFDALQSSIDARFQALDSSVDARFDALRSSIDARFQALDSSVDAGLDTLQSRIDASDSGIDARIEAAKSEILFRMFQMIMSAVVVNVIAMLGIMFGFAKLLGH